MPACCLDCLNGRFFSAVGPWAPAPHAESLAQVPHGLGLGVLSRPLSCPVWGRATRWVCTHWHPPQEHQFGSSQAAVTCCPGCAMPLPREPALLPPDMGSGTPLSRARRLPGHIPPGHSICASHAKKAPVGSVPKPTLPPRIPQCSSPPSEDKKALGSWPAVPSPPHREQGRAVAPRTMGDCPGTAIPAAAPCREQTGNKGSAMGERWDPPSPVCLPWNAAGPGGSRSSWPALLPKPCWDPQGWPAGCWAKLASFIFTAVPPGKWHGRFPRAGVR